MAEGAVAEEAAIVELAWTAEEVGALMGLSWLWLAGVRLSGRATLGRLAAEVALEVGEGAVEVWTEGVGWGVEEGEAVDGEVEVGEATLDGEEEEEEEAVEAYAEEEEEVSPEVVEVGGVKRGVEEGEGEEEEEEGEGCWAVPFLFLFEVDVMMRVNALGG